LYSGKKASTEEKIKNQQNQCHQKYRSECDLNQHTRTHTHLISPAHFSEENRDASKGVG